MTARLTGQRCRCPACGLVFSTVRNYDQHRVGTFAPPARRCMAEDEMTARGLLRTAAGVWVRAYDGHGHCRGTPTSGDRHEGDRTHRGEVRP